MLTVKAIISCDSLKLKINRMKNIEKQAMAIVTQLFDLAELPVDKRKEINDIAYNYVTEQLIITDVVLPKGTLPKSDAEIIKQALKKYGTGQKDCIYEQKTAYVKGAMDYRDNKI